MSITIGWRISASGKLVRKMARLPGARESRWSHLLSGAPAETANEGLGPTDTPNADLSWHELAALKANVARLETELSTLRQLLTRVCTELGMEAPANPD